MVVNFDGEVKPFVCVQEFLLVEKRASYVVNAAEMLGVDLDP